MVPCATVRGTSHGRTRVLWSWAAGATPACGDSRQRRPRNCIIRVQSVPACMRGLFPVSFPTCDSQFSRPRPLGWESTTLIPGTGSETPALSNAALSAPVNLAERQAASSGERNFAGPPFFRDGALPLRPYPTVSAEDRAAGIIQVFPPLSRIRTTAAQARIIGLRNRLGHIATAGGASRIRISREFAAPHRHHSPVPTPNLYS